MISKSINTKRYFPKGEKQNYIKLQEWNNLNSLVEKKIFIDSYKAASFFMLTDNEDKFSISYNILKPIYTLNSAFLKNDCTAFVSYNKQTKKCFQRNSSQIYYRLEESQSLINSARLDFLNLKKDYCFITESSSKLLFERKITNSLQLFKYFLKTSYKIKIDKLPISLLYSMMSKSSYKFICRILKTSVNIESSIRNLEKIINYPHISDLLSQVEIFSERINYSVSYRRLEELHANYNDRITAMKITKMKDEKIGYKKPIPYSESIQLLESKIEFYKEAQEMRHCLFSNDYFDVAKKNNRFYFKYDNHQRGTIELVVENNIPHIRQFFGKRNVGLSKETHANAMKIIKETFMEYLISNPKSIENS